MSNTDASPAGSPEGYLSSNQLLVTYPNVQDQYAYLSLPSAALYKLHKIQSTADTVDASSLDTGRYLSFTWPSDRDLNVVMYGYLDSTDLSKPLLVAPGHGDYQHGSGWEAIYPGKKYFQKFDLMLKGYNTSKDKPTFYSFSGSFGTASHGFILTAPADSTLNPVNMLTILTKGKFLSGQDATSLHVNGFTFTNDANPDYRSYMTNAANAAKANKRPFSYQRSLSVGM